MRFFIRRRVALALTVTMGLAGNSLAAEAWPAGPIRMLVGYTAGGPTDHAARLFAKEMGTALGKPIVIENKPGQNGQTFLSEVKRVKPDGYTVFFATSGPLGVAPARFKSLPFDVARDFDYIGTVSGYPSLLVTKGDSPLKSVDELIAKSKANAAGLSAGTVSNTQELTLARFAQVFGVKAIGVPYKGDSQAITDVAAGTVDFAFLAPNVALPLVDSGRIKVLGVAGSLPAPNATRFPRIKGLDVLVWNGLLVPKGTPPEIRKKLEAALSAAQNSKEIEKLLNSSGQAMLRHQGEAFRSFTIDENKLWASVMQKAGIEKQ